MLCSCFGRRTHLPCQHSTSTSQLSAQEARASEASEQLEGLQEQLRPTPLQRFEASTALQPFLANNRRLDPKASLLSPGPAGPSGLRFRLLGGELQTFVLVVEFRFQGLGVLCLKKRKWRGEGC